MANRRLSNLRLKTSRYLLIVGLLLFFLGPLVIYYIRPSGQVGLLPGLGALLCIIAVFIGKNQLVCPKCGKPMLTIAVDMTHCSKCGASYFDENSNL